MTTFEDLMPASPEMARAEQEPEPERELVRYTVFRLPSGECRITADFTSTEEREIDFAHIILLDMLRRQIDRARGQGEAAKIMFVTAVNPDPAAEQSEREADAEDGDDAPLKQPANGTYDPGL